mgnify:CR=1 FL=1
MAATVARKRRFKNRIGKKVKGQRRVKQPTADIDEGEQPDIAPKQPRMRRFVADDRFQLYSMLLWLTNYEVAYEAERAADPALAAELSSRLASRGVAKSAQQNPEGRQAGQAFEMTEGDALHIFCNDSPFPSIHVH